MDIRSYHTITKDMESPFRLYFGEKGSWWYAVKDIHILQQLTKEYLPDIPYFLFGHSMGSFLMRSYLIKNLSSMDGCILCGTGYPSKIKVGAGRCVISLTSLFKGRTAYSPMVDHLIFGWFNKKLTNTTSSSDWVSKNPENINEYVQDPLCGGDVTQGLFGELLYGSGYCTKTGNIKKMNHDIPILLISGADDPVGGMSKGVQKTYAALKKRECKMYPFNCIQNYDMRF